VGIARCPAHSGGLETGQELENNDAMQTLKDKLASDRFVITAEITPPVSCDAADLVVKATPLKGLADAINVTDGAGARAHLDAVAAAAILIREGIEPILQFNCRDSNRIALQSEGVGTQRVGATTTQGFQPLVFGRVGQAVVVSNEASVRIATAFRVA